MGYKEPTRFQAEEGQWPSPSSQGSHGEISEDLERRGTKLINKKTGRILQTNLGTEVKHWGTPKVHNAPVSKKARAVHKSTDTLAGNVRNWHTPHGMANCDKKGKRGGASGGEFGQQAMRVTESWATPRASENENRMTRLAPSHDGKRHGRVLAGQAGSWRSPNARDHHPSKPGNTKQTPQIALPNETSNRYWKRMERHEKNWPSPRSEAARPDHSRARRHQKHDKSYKGDDLGTTAEREGRSWVTPASRDFKGVNSAKHVRVTGKGKKHMDQLSNQVEFASFLSGRPGQGTAKRGRGSSPSDPTSRQRSQAVAEATVLLNPKFVEWLMNWPEGHTSLQPISKEAFKMWEQSMRNCLARIV